MRLVRQPEVVERSTTSANRSRLATGKPMGKIASQKFVAPLLSLARSRPDGSLQCSEPLFQSADAPD
jgi:hypothetical protein